MDFAMFFSLDEFESLKNILFRFFFCALVISSTPLGPLPCTLPKLNHKLLQQDTGTADHLLLLQLLEAVL